MLQVLKTLAICAVLAVAWPSAASAFSIKVSWKGTSKCSDSQSPIIRLSGVPKKTKTIRFHMTDLDKLTAQHGGGTVAYTGRKTLPKGAFSNSYRGPCPPAPHRYRWTAKALDATGKTVGSAQTTVRFSP